MSRMSPRLRALSARRPAWQEKPKPPTVIGKALALVALVAAVAVPFWVVLSTSLSTNQQVISDGGYTFWPHPFTLRAYLAVIHGDLVTHAALVSVGVVVVGTAVSLAATILLAYALARPGTTLSRPVTKLTLIAFLFPPGLIPSYLIVDQLHLLDNYASLVLPVAIDVFNLVVLRGFFQGLPNELYEAARLDGCGEVRMLFQIVLPLSRTPIAMVGFFYGVAYWNDFFRGMFYLNDAGKYPLGTLLRVLITTGVNPDANGSTASSLTADSPTAALMATIIIAIIPILAAYPLISKFFTKGVLIGAVKA